MLLLHWLSGLKQGLFGSRNSVRHTRRRVGPWRSRHLDASFPRIPEVLEDRTLLSPVHLVIPGTSGNDTISVDHSSSTTTITKNGTATVYLNDNLLSISIQSGAGNDTIFINGTPNLPTTVLAGTENDTIIVGGGKYDFNIGGELTINGGDGVDELTIDDALNNRILLSSDSYKLDRELRNGVEYGTFAKGRLIPQSPPVPEGFGPNLAFTGVEDVTLEGSLSPDRFDVNATPANVELTLKGNDNDDIFNVGGGDYDNNIRSPISLVGGLGDNNVEIDDTTDNGDGEHYVLNNSTFTKINTGVSNVPTLVYSSIVEFTVQGSDFDNVFQVDSTHFSTEYVLRGNDGADEFLVLAEGLLSDVRVMGGQPNSVPGDTLRVTGSPEQTAKYNPDVYDPGAGAVVTQGRTIHFSGLEPVLLDGFASVTMITPRSYDVINVSPEADGWTKISGSSGGIASGGTPFLLPFKSLSFRDVRNVTLDTASLDSIAFPYPVGANAVVYGAFPDDTVRIQPGAMNARGLDRFSVLTGTGVNSVNDHTLESGTPVSGRLNVDGAGGTSFVSLYGASARADVEQFTGKQSEFAAYDAAGNPLYSGGFFFIELLDMLTPWDSFRAIGENIDRRLSGTTRQTVAGPGLTTVRVAPGLTDSELEIVALGTDRIELLNVLFPVRTLSGLRDAGPQPEPPVSPDNITIAYSDEFAAGPQPEPPRMRVTGYGPEDRLNREGATLLDGSPVPTDFDLSFIDSEHLIELLVVFPASPLSSRLKFNIETGDMGAAPALGFIGDTSVENNVHVVRNVAIDPVMIMPLPVILRNIELLDVDGSTDAERLSVSTSADGGLQISSVNMLDIGRDIYFAADENLRVIQTDGRGGGDEFNAQYPEPDFRSFRTDLTGFETVNLVPDPVAILIGLLEPVRQTLTPTVGEFRTSTLLITHDDALTTSFVEASEYYATVTGGTFTRGLSLNASFTGSEGHALIDGACFEEPLEINVQQKTEGNNSMDVTIQNSKFKKQAVVKISGGENGESKVKISKQNVAGEVKAIYDSEKTILDMQLENFDEAPLEATIINPNGTTTFTKVGNVIVSVPDLVGTDIDPTKPFTTFVVTSTADSGPGSLRAAIDAANAFTGQGYAVITFAIPETDPHYVDVDANLPGGDVDPDVFAISPMTALPALTRGDTIINGQSQQNTAIRIPSVPKLCSMVQARWAKPILRGWSANTGSKDRRKMSWGTTNPRPPRAFTL